MVVAGGNAIIFGASLILDLRKKSIQETDPISRDEGMKIGVAVKKNHCINTNPYLRTEYYAIFNVGTEVYLEALDNAIAQGILVKNGSFIKDIDEATGEVRSWDSDTKLTWQGKEAYRNFCKANPSYFKELLSRIKGETTQMTGEEVGQIIDEVDEITQSVPVEVIEAVTETVNSVTKEVKKKSSKKR
jgi:hypothetical protein